MKEIHGGLDATKRHAREIASSRKLSSRLAVAAFAGILVFYSTTLRSSTGRAIKAAHHAPNATALALVVGDEPDDDTVSVESMAAVVAAVKAHEESDGGTRLAWPEKMPNDGRTKKGKSRARVGVRRSTQVLYLQNPRISRHTSPHLTRNECNVWSASTLKSGFTSAAIGTTMEMP